MIFEPHQIGCHSKPSYLQLASILEKSSGIDVAVDWCDLTEIDGEYAYSIDTVGIISDNDLRLSALSAIAHCSNDIVCRGYTPLHVASSYQFNSDILNDEKQVAFIREMHTAAKEMPFVLGKSHTIYANDNYLTLTTIGKLRYQQDDIVSDKEYTLILSKKLGALRCYILNMLKDQSEKVSSEAEKSLIMNHSSALDVLKNVTCATTDVSGNGLLGTLWLLKEKFSLDITVEQNDIKCMGKQFGSVPLSSCASNKNRSSFAHAIESENQFENDFIEESFFTPEYSGPLLIVADKAQQQHIINGLSSCGFTDAHVIGKAIVGNSPKVVLNHG